MISAVTCLLFLATAGALAAASAAAAIGASNQQQQFPSVASGGGAGISADFGDGGFSDGISPPDPSKFKTPEELKEYLERLQLYYALVGRPRFGKRSGRDFSSSRGGVAQANFDYNRKAEEDEDEAEESAAAIPRDRIYGFTVLL